MSGFGIVTCVYKPHEQEMQWDNFAINLRRICQSNPVFSQILFSTHYPWPRFTTSSAISLNIVSLIISFNPVEKCSSLPESKYFLFRIGSRATANRKRNDLGAAIVNIGNSARTNTHNLIYFYEHFSLVYKYFAFSLCVFCLSRLRLNCANALTLLYAFAVMCALSKTILFFCAAAAFLRDCTLVHCSSVCERCC